MKLWTWNRVDRITGTVVAVPIRLLCAITGLEPTAIAYICAALSAGFGIGYDMHRHFGGAVLMDLILMPVVLLWLVFVFIPRMREAMDQVGQRQVLPVTLHSNSLIGWVRGIFLPVSMVLANLGRHNSYLVLSDTFILLGYYAATFYGPQKPAWYTTLIQAARLRLAPVS